MAVHSLFTLPDSSSLRIARLTLVVLALGTGVASRAAQVIDLWPGQPPSEKGVIGEEQDMTKPTDNLVAGRRLIRLGNVTKPTLTVYRPPAANDNGAAVLVCPGGAYSILALDLEGTEVCEWLNSIGVTGLLLKYRVPKREGLERHTVALQDAQRAMGLARQRANEWGIDAQRLGVLGFSAGAHLAASVSTHARERTYAPMDDADRIDCRPDFTVLIYPAYLTVKEQGDKVAPDLPVTTDTPPTFIAMAQDDPVRVETALFYALALKQANVPVELHVYPSGGHGYGLRRTEELVTTWPDRVSDWLLSRGWLKAKVSRARP